MTKIDKKFTLNGFSFLLSEWCGTETHENSDGTFYLKILLINRTISDKKLYFSSDDDCKACFNAFLYAMTNDVKELIWP